MSFGSSPPQGPIVHTTANPLAPLTTVKPGCKAINILFEVPDAEAADVDKFFAEHKSFIDETHPTAGDKEPVILYYTVTKAAQTKDPADPASEKTGKQMYALCEIYKSMDGCMAHITEGKKKEAFFAKFNELVGKYSKSVSMMAEVVASL